MWKKTLLLKMANKNVVSNKRSSQTKCSVSSARYSAPFRAAMGNIYTSKFKYIQCWDAKPFNVQFTKAFSAGMSKGNVEQLMSTKSIVGASGVVISTRCKAQRKIQKQDVKVLWYAKQCAAIPVKNRLKKTHVPLNRPKTVSSETNTRLERG